MTRKTAYRMAPWLLVAAGTVLASAISRRMRRYDFRGKSVVIAGGSRGLGLEMARQLGVEGAKIVLLARSTSELERARRELAATGVDAITFTCDIRHRAEVMRTVAAIIARTQRIDVLINNAGIIQVAPFENLDFSDYEESVDTHAWGPLNMIRAVTPLMQERKTGRIINISSIGGFVPIPHLLAYTMGKFALTGLSEGLRAELAKDGIVVTTVAPGLMRTGSHVNAFFKGQYRKEFGWFSISGSNPLLSINVQRAAREIIDASRYGDPRLIMTLPAKVLHLADALFPRITATGSAMAARLLPSPAPRERNVLHTGWQSGSWAAPSVLTRLSDRAVRMNNEG